MATCLPTPSWYGSFRTTIKATVYLKGIQTQIHDCAKQCMVYQCIKYRNILHDHISTKKVETIPWQILCVDYIGAYNVDNMLVFQLIFNVSLC